MKNLFLVSLIAAFSFSCSSNEEREEVDFQAWGNYWFQGEAELSTFELKQYRYGEERQGTAVLIFVTEEFSRKNRVKLDNPDDAGRDKQSVLKMNQMREFVTGIYPYHMMLSAFTPTKEKSNGVKFTASSQEWCGHSFTQLQLGSGDSYSGQLHSYFEGEGDQDISFNGLLEDDLWNLLRINPNQIPIGSVQMMPSLLYQRFTHRNFEPEEAFIRIQDISNNNRQLEVTYSSGVRTLRINFEKDFPFQIMGWEEQETREDGKQELTSASRKSVKQLDYWTRNKVEDEFLRRELNLTN